jgi:hypothetical protein
VSKAHGPECSEFLQALPTANHQSWESIRMLKRKIFDGVRAINCQLMRTTCLIRSLACDESNSKKITSMGVIRTESDRYMEHIIGSWLMMITRVAWLGFVVDQGFESDLFDRREDAAATPRGAVLVQVKMEDCLDVHAPFPFNDLHHDSKANPACLHTPFSRFRTRISLTERPLKFTVDIARL